MLSAAIIKAMAIYGIAIVISMVVALLIKLMVRFTARLERAAAPAATVCPVGPGIQDEDVAALSAAIFAAIGQHRIVHIAEHGHAWAVEGRVAAHSSHAVPHRPKH